MKKLLMIFVAIAALIILARQILIPNIIAPKMAPKIFAKAVNKTLGTDPMAGLEDGLHIYICGAGAPLPDPKRSGPCLGIIAGERAFMIDAGSVRNLSPMGFPIDRIEQIYLTHLHSDHIDSLGEALLANWVSAGRSHPLPVTGPEGVSDVVSGFNTAYKLDSQFRAAHHGVGIANPAGFGGAAQTITLPPASNSVVLLNESGLKVTAFTVPHEPVSPAFGYRVDYKDRSVVISGDTAFDPNIASHAKDVDVLLHEALSKDMVGTMQEAADNAGNHNLAKIFSDILDYHASPVEAAQTAHMANAKHLVLYHIVPPLPVDALKPMFLKGTADEFKGKITLSQDGLIIRLPAQSEAIIYEQRL